MEKKPNKSSTKNRSFLLICSIMVAIVGLTFFAFKPNDEILFEKSVIWDPGEGIEGYRIPGIVISKKGTVLAFAEERPSYGDADPKSLVVKRSEDKGSTWSKNIYIEKSDGSFWAKNTNPFYPTEEKGKKEVWTNVAPIVDMVTGRIFFFYALSEGEVAGQNLQRYTRVFYRYSDDDGLTWSERKEVTKILNSKSDGTPNKDEDGNWITDKNGFPCDYMGRAFHMPGPGHGIQLSDGRLLLQVWNRKALGILGEGEIPVEKRKYGLSTIYSDDHGETWKYGSAFGHNFDLNESRMVELDNGDVYLNGRYTSEEYNTHRVTAISYDGGVHWENIKIDKNFPLSHSCDAGLIGLRHATEKDINLILYSKNESTEGRKNLVVRWSKDGGKSWSKPRTVDEGRASYSDMAVLPDNTVLLIYEKGKNMPIYCVRFNLDWLMNNQS